MEEENVSPSHNAVVQSSQEELPTSATLEQIDSCAKLGQEDASSPTAWFLNIEPREILEKEIDWEIHILDNMKMSFNEDGTTTFITEFIKGGQE